ncbi:hypothetical protein DFH05DRAFT_1478013 [Lentinula detonsa]|uniref:Uncharacterized protein n=1 Tax=Lentinula detonsa TaxID=2804962 RepID=A0A9W8P9N2_9AGAR|nr:hypothetical protein DFH05DRAFT_1478013 [Lentinula detonsa]
MSMFSHANHFSVNGGRFIQNIHNNTESDTQKTPPGYFEGMTHCPTSTKTFTGREEVLTRLEEFFLSGNAAEGMKIFLLCGLGGAGKTQIALQFIKRFKQR